MRVIAGLAKGLPLKAPPKVTRPTTDRVKESVFSILGELVDGAKVLDLFAGSGALGIEALSRGAASCVFVDQDRFATKVIGENLAKTKLSGGTVSQASVFAFLKNARGYDLILADPPYADYRQNLAAELVQTEGWREALAADGLLVVESEAMGESAQSPELEVVTERVYGRSRITIYRLKAGEKA